MSLASRVTGLVADKPLSLDEFLASLDAGERDAAEQILRNPRVQHVTVVAVFAEEYPETGSFTSSTVGRWRRLNGVTR